MDYMYPDYNFPSGPYSSLSRRIFSYYGSSFIDTGKNREFDCQRVEPVKEFGSVSPVIPLLDAPAEGEASHFPDPPIHIHKLAKYISRTSMA